MILAAPVPVGAQETPAAPVVVLDTTGFWRMHCQLKPPMVDQDGRPKPVLYDQAWLDTPTPPPPAGWTARDFDDGAWVRAVTLRACKTPYAARICLRGKFAVTDPRAVRGLSLTVGYHGGAVVVVNGKEIARGHLPKGPVGDTTLAEGYPPEASVTERGEFINRRTSRSAEIDRRRALRERVLADVPIPASLLRQGVNVVAIDIVRAPYHRIHFEKKEQSRRRTLHHRMPWYTCEIRRVQLAAPKADGLVPNAVRPAGLQVWNSDVMMSDFDLDFGDANEPLRPVTMVGARNGTFSGKVVVSSDKPIRGLKATAGSLTGGGATIPASAVRVRYAGPWGTEWITIPYSYQSPAYPRPADVMGALLESPPEEVPVREKPPVRSRYRLQTPNQPEPVFGAVVPVWVTVTVPPDARPGTYTGQVRITARGEKPVSVPVELTVVDWKLPDTQDYDTWIELIQSPDTLAMEYDLELWSDRHWKMIEQAFDHIGEVGSRVVHVPLVAQTNLGHEQSMVRWIRKSDGTYDYDFTVMDRYLDAAVKHMGRPKIICFWVWEIYLIEKEKYHGKDHLILEQAIAAREAMRGEGPMVTALDPATGKTETVRLPPYKDPASKALWAPLMEKIQQRLKARGLRDTMMFGMINDTRPTKEEVAFFDAMAPGTPWVSQAHGGFRQKDLLHGIAPIGYQARVWGVHFSTEKSVHGWNIPHLMAHYDRDRALNPKTPALWTHLAEMCITGDQRGIGRLGADYWPILKDKQGRRKGYVWARYPHSSWRNLDLWSYALAPGPDGPVSTPHLEHLREGIQHCEARILLERVLLDTALSEKIGPDLARRCQEALDERHMAMVRSMAAFQMDPPGEALTWRSGTEIGGHIWFVGSGWQRRSRKLYALAGEVARKLAAR